MILVVGSTGKLGIEVCWLLRTKNLPVRAMVRNTSDPEKLDRLRAMGVSLMKGDLRDKTTLPHALTGITTVITTVSSMPFSYLPGENDIQKVDEEGMIDLIDESRKEGVSHFIYTSFSKNMNLDFPLKNAKRKVENHLQQSGMQYTILRPSCFMEAWLSAGVGFDAINGRVNLCGTGTNPVAYIAIPDVARFAVECVSNPDALNAVLELGGPQNLSQIEAVHIFEDVLKKKIEIQYIPVEALKAQYDQAGDGMQKSFSGLMLCVANGDPIDMKEMLVKYPVKLTSVKEFAKMQAERLLKPA
jgi:NADH dehydrogenase